MRSPLADLEAAPELDPKDARLADEVVAIVHSVVGGALIGMYLHGSAVMGGLRRSSDLDVLAIVDRPTIETERKALVDALLEISGSRASRGPARPIELTLLLQSKVRPWPYPPEVEFVYGEWLRDRYERGFVPAAAPMLDLGPEIAITLRGDHALFGPPPAELLDPIPMAAIRRAIVSGIPTLLGELESDTRNILLTFARIWSTVATGAITSKDEAAAWALQRLPDEHRGVLVRARELYLAGEDGDWTAAREAVFEHAAYVVAEIERLAKRSNACRSAPDVPA